MPLIRKLKISVGILLALMLVNINLVNAQCTGCTTVITGGSSNFSVNPGQVVCIAAGVTYTGNIVLNGGVLCNQGTLTKVDFNKGTLNNYGVFNDVNSLAIKATGNLYINCYNGSTFSVTTGVTLQSTNINDSVVIYNSTGSRFTTGKGFSMHNTKLIVYNGGNLSGAFALFNVGAAFSITDSTTFKLRNYASGNFNVTSNLSFNGAGNKSIVNNGIFNVDNAVTMSGTGNTTDLISIVNNHNFNVTGNISTAVNNTGVIITNNVGATLSSGISLTLSKATNTLINNGQLMIGQDFIVQNGVATNTGFISTGRDLKISSGSFQNSGSSIVQRNCIIQTNAVASNSGNLVSEGNFQITTASFTNSSSGLIGVVGSALIQSTATVANYGTMSSYGEFKMTSSSLTNYSVGSVSTGTDCTVQNSSSMTNNGTLTAVGSLRINNNASFTNNNLSSISTDFLITSSSQAVNNGTMNVTSNVNITTSTLTNNSILKTINNFSATNTSAVFNNNSYLEVDNEFKNIATVNLALNSVLKLNNYINTGSSATINGPVSSPDTASYAKIIISGSSTNNNYINGDIVVYDYSLVGTTSNNGYGFDVITNPTRIANTIVFASRSTGPNKPPFINCNPLNSFYNVFATASPFSIACGGAPSQLSAQLTLVTFTPGPFGPYYIPVNSPPVIYTWLPTNQVGQNISVTPINTTNYTVIANYGSCIYTNVVTVVVTSPSNYFVNIAGSPDIIFPYPDGVTLNSSVTGGQSPYTYAWTPNIYFLPPGNLVQNPQVNPPIALNYVVTVTDANGCITSTNVNVIPAPYAPLNKIPDGGYYKLVNNRMLFKYDGQYANTSLTYNVYDKSNGLVNNLTTVSTLAVKSGDNRYSLNATNLTAGQYYTLEVINEKKEKLYLRFKR